MKFLRHLPNVLTLINLLLGVLAILSLTNALVMTALILMGGSLVADVMDGAIARRLGISEGLGVQLDSLADMVTFGVLPGMMVFYCGARYGGGTPGQETVAIFSALMVVSAGLRLGRFNIDTRPREYFWGLATPSGAIMVAAWLWAQHSGRDYGFGAAEMPWLNIAVPLFLMIMYQVSLRLPGLKSPKGGLWILGVLAMLTLVGFILIGPIAISVGILVYVLIGLVNLILKLY